MRHGPRDDAAVAREMKRARQNRWVKAQRQCIELEVNLEQKVVAYVEGVLRRWAPKYGREGWPDRLVVLGSGRHCWFEFKRRKFSHLTPAQKRRIPMLRRAGEHVYVVKTFAQAVDALACEAPALMWAQEERR